jgi:hypothetical protein
MAECTDNIPPKRRSLIERVISELDVTGYVDEESERDWIETNVAFADYYGIDLCDEAEAHLLADFVLRVTENPLGATRAPQTPEEVWGSHHHEFMVSYANLHGVPVPAVPQRGGMFWASDVQAAMRALTLEHSVATPLPPEPVILQTGNSTIILGEANALTCDPAAVDAWKASATSKAAPVSSVQPFYTYQVAKCGPREYQLEALVTFITDYVPDSVLSALGLEHQDVLKTYADGITSRPPAGARRKAYGCCATDAKRVMNVDRTLYQPARRYRRQMRIKHAAKVGKALRWAVAAEMARWAAVRASALRQLLGYAAACLDPDTPVNRFLYIVSHNLAEEYFGDLLGGPGQIGHVVLSPPSSAENWIG